MFFVCPFLCFAMLVHTCPCSALLACVLVVLLMCCVLFWSVLRCFGFPFLALLYFIFASLPFDIFTSLPQYLIACRWTVSLSSLSLSQSQSLSVSLSSLCLFSVSVSVSLPLPLPIPLPLPLPLSGALDIIRGTQCHRLQECWLREKTFQWPLPPELHSLRTATAVRMHRLPFQFEATIAPSRKWTCQVDARIEYRKSEVGGDLDLRCPATWIAWSVCVGAVGPGHEESACQPSLLLHCRRRSSGHDWRSKGVDGHGRVDGHRGHSVKARQRTGRERQWRDLR